MSLIEVTEYDGLGHAPRRPRPNNNNWDQENVRQDVAAGWGRVVHDIPGRHTPCGMDRLLEVRR